MSGTEPSPEAAPTTAPSEAWRVLGRDSPAGAALYKLYGGDCKGKNVGQEFHKQNKARHEAAVAAGWTPPVKEAATPVPRPTVSYPKFGTKQPTKVPALHSIPRRKPAEQILREMDQERDQLRSAQHRPPGPLLDAAEKERCALLMQHRGKLPAAAVAGTSGARSQSAGAPQPRRPAPKSEAEELQSLFSQVLQEIEERKAFLADLESYGALKRDVQQQVRVEIKQRVEELQKLDAMIKSASAAR
ncbi:hypothetical protein V8C86DRAFT_2495332 [Haematococcus lacustris]